MVSMLFDAAQEGVQAMTATDGHYLGAAQPLPVPRGTVSGRAHAINNLGEIVGWLDIVPKNYAGFYPYAYLWKDGAMVNLEKQIDDDSGWDRLWYAYVINDGGVIAGVGRCDVDSRGFLLIPNSP